MPCVYKKFLFKFNLMHKNRSQQSGANDTKNLEHEVELGATLTAWSNSQVIMAINGGYQD